MKPMTERMWEAMMAKGYTPVRLAKELEEKVAQKKISPDAAVSSQGISQWKPARGEAIKSSKKIKAEILFAAADILGYEARWIATGAGPKEVKPDTQELLKAWALIPADVRAGLMQRIGLVAQAYREPVEDARLSEIWAAPQAYQGPERRLPKPQTENQHVYGKRSEEKSDEQ